MYKLFLTIRYLTRRKIVIFPILVVWLCLMMMIIVTSIMGGFVDRVRETNRELLGDVVISSKSSVGWSGYEELQGALAKQFPEIETSTPVVEAFGLVNFPRFKVSKGVLLVGIDPVGRSRVSRFRETLFEQYMGPEEAVDDVAKFLPATRQELIDHGVELQKKAQDREEDAYKGLLAAEKAGAGGSTQEVNAWWLIGLAAPVIFVVLAIWVRRARGWTVTLAVLTLVVAAAGFFWPAIFGKDYAVAEDRVKTGQAEEARLFRTVQFIAALPDDGKKYADRAELEKTLVPRQVSFAVPPLAKLINQDASDQGVIAGVQIGMYEKDQRGNFRRPEMPAYLSAVVTVFPVNENGKVATSGIVTSTEQFTIVDDSYTGVYDVDSLSMYAPFEKVQLMAHMRPDPKLVAMDPTADFAPRCNEVLIKLKNDSSPSELRRMRAQIKKFVDNWQDAHPDMDSQELQVETWDERQAKYLGAVENEKTMMTFIMGLMSLVVLVVIFLIFYMIVRDKTRDIGIIKAIGGSEEGVAGIFLFYGLFIGLVGGILGVISGVAFVMHTNQIHEWIYQLTGIVIWDRSVYLFDEIPHAVHPAEVAIYFGLAVLAGVIGALIPAVAAGAENPVRAVRYE